MARRAAVRVRVPPVAGFVAPQCGQVDALSPRLPGLRRELRHGLGQSCLQRDMQLRDVRAILHRGPAATTPRQESTRRPRRPRRPPKRPPKRAPRRPASLGARAAASSTLRLQPQPSLETPRTLLEPRAAAARALHDEQPSPLLLRPAARRAPGLQASRRRRSLSAAATRRRGGRGAAGCSLQARRLQAAAPRALPAAQPARQWRGGADVAAPPPTRLAEASARGRCSATAASRA